MFNKLFNIFNRKEVTVQLDDTTSLVLKPTVGGANAVLTTTSGVFVRTERAFFSSCDELIKSLNLTDDAIVKKLAKAF